MARATPIKWIQEQGGWTTATVLLDTYAHYLPTESAGYADALTATPNGPRTAPDQSRQVASRGGGAETDDDTESYEDGASATHPRSPIMHFTLPPPFLRNSETSTVIGVVPRSWTWPRRSSETPAGMTR